MAGWQQVIIIGNLGRDAEMRYLQSGQGVCSFNVAVSETWSDRQTNEKREKTNWFKVSAWGQLGESIHQYLTKEFVVGSKTSKEILFCLPLSF